MRTMRRLGSHNFKTNKMGKKLFPDQVVFNTIHMNQDGTTGEELTLNRRRQFNFLYPNIYP